MILTENPPTTYINAIVCKETKPPCPFFGAVKKEPIHWNGSGVHFHRNPIVPFHRGDRVAGLVGAVEAIQRLLAAAVATAYGWPADISDDDALAELRALNLANGR